MLSLVPQVSAAAENARVLLDLVFVLEESYTYGRTSRVRLVVCRSEMQMLRLPGFNPRFSPPGIDIQQYGTLLYCTGVLLLAYRCSAACIVCTDSTDQLHAGNYILSDMMCATKKNANHTRFERIQSWSPVGGSRM